MQRAKKIAKFNWILLQCLTKSAYIYNAIICSIVVIEERLGYVYHTNRFLCHICCNLLTNRHLISVANYTYI